MLPYNKGEVRQHTHTYWWSFAVNQTLTRPCDTDYTEVKTNNRTHINHITGKIEGLAGGWVQTYSSTLFLSYPYHTHIIPITLLCIGKLILTGIPQHYNTKWSKLVEGSSLPKLFVLLVNQGSQSTQTDYSMNKR